MQSLWNQHRGRCYEKIISFSLIVHLIADALLKYNGSGRRAFEKAIENEELDASIQAAFKKLGRLPVPLSQAFLSDCTAALREAFPEWAEWQTPKSLRGFRVITLDGKAIKRVAKRLKPLQGIPADADVFSRPGATALKRTREKLLNDLARNASDESRAALIGAM